MRESERESEIQGERGREGEREGGRCLGMHVGAEGVDSLNDRLIDDLSVLVAVLAEHINLRHHARHVEASSRGVERDMLLHSSVRTRM